MTKYLIFVPVSMESPRGASGGVGFVHAVLQEAKDAASGCSAVGSTTVPPVMVGGEAR